uniref:Uncharacterized protein n=1 Tax=Salix viminalis TaxID=40686 RepID=A0A6N2MS62_SALVM
MQMAKRIDRVLYVEIDDFSVRYDGDWSVELENACLLCAGNRCVILLRIAVRSGLNQRPDRNNPKVEQGRHIHERSREPDTREPTFAKGPCTCILN